MSTRLVITLLCGSILSGCQSYGGVMSADDTQPNVSKLSLSSKGQAKDKKVDVRPPSLEEVLRKGKPLQGNEGEKGLDTLRITALEEAALSYGARSGLAYRTDKINQTLQTNSSELAELFEFTSVMIDGPDGSIITPPVIVEAKEAWELYEKGKALRVADTVYEVIDQARFTSVPPLWQSYLISSFEEASEVPAALTPNNKAEGDIWVKGVTRGWREGEEQANQIFKTNLARLSRDYAGMVRYKRLLEEGKVTSPIVALGSMGTTGNGENMRVNDRAIRITQDSKLVLDTNKWESSPTYQSDSGQIEGVRELKDTVIDEVRKSTSAWDKPSVQGKKSVPPVVPTPVKLAPDLKKDHF
ncbi:type IV secretory system conjugative DNA transfer family protein [Flexibacterium corallicola]|uniref:type IV secretory system conjugative DNA transfer family protein n=1 Tax=Flexibacterium corallicola TaxID=3037259 RepID=UPI00286EC643|nr:type IV secretory system conjugative DNA transfer family protein [Pseudovibrio sp. M1P-2-3]